MPILSGKPLPPLAVIEILELFGNTGVMLRGSMEMNLFLQRAPEGGVTEWRLLRFGGKFWNADDRWYITIEEVDYSNIAKNKVVDAVNEQLEEIYSRYR